MKLRYSPEALAELEAVLAYIAERSPRGAQNVSKRLKIIIDFIAQNPLAGVELKGRGLRRIAAMPYPYLVIYQVNDDEVVIAGIRHAARKPGS